MTGGGRGDGVCSVALSAGEDRGGGGIHEDMFCSGLSGEGCMNRRGGMGWCFLSNEGNKCEADNTIHGEVAEMAEGALPRSYRTKYKYYI